MCSRQEILEVALHLIMERDGMRIGFCNDKCNQLYYEDILQQGINEIHYIDNLIKEKELNVEDWVNTYPIGLSGTVKYLLSKVN